MRLLRLPPPRRLAPLFWEAGTDEVSTADQVHHQALAEPETTDFRRRHLFDPEHGWFRRTERAVNKFLCRRIYPHVPLMRRPYSAILNRSLTVGEARVTLPGLGGSGELRVLVISDIHAGPFVSGRALQHAFDRLSSLRPDLVLLPGDFATVTVEEVERVAPVLRSLQAPMGVFGVLGNHDHYTSDIDRLSRVLETSGIELLQNRSVELEHQGARMLLGGVDDLLLGEPDLKAALRGRREGMPTVVLSHNPDVFPEAVKRGVSLMLAGHTHGGQVRVPGLPVLVRMSRYRLDEGRFAVGDSELIVSRGLGATGFPVRLGCPPEALLLSLASD